MTTWFTADHHFGHANIIRFTGRPFRSAEEMDGVLIERWNAEINPDDDVYHLGDIGLCGSGHLRRILEQLNGRIHLIRGNHDRAAQACNDRLVWIRDLHELSVEDPEAHQGRRLIVLCHYAMRVWKASHYGSWHLYGHSHGNLPDLPESLSFDAGVDCHDFRPISYERVRELMAGKRWRSPIA